VWRGATQGRRAKTLQRVKGIEPSYSAWKAGLEIEEGGGRWSRLTRADGGQIAAKLRRFSLNYRAIPQNFPQPPNRCLLGPCGSEAGVNFMEPLVTPADGRL